MKRMLLVCLLSSLLITPAVFAQMSPVTADVGVGLTWSERFNTGEEFLDMIIGLRGGAWIDLMYRPGPLLEVGAELGMYYMSWETSAGSMFLGDFPITAKASLNFGPLSLDALGGVLLTLDMGNAVLFGVNYLAGARAGLGWFYAEVDYIIDADVVHTDERASYLRYGIGIKRNLSK